MKVKLANIEQGFMNYFTKEIATLSWTTTALVPLMPLVINNVKNKYITMLTLLMDSEGYIDIDTLHKEYSAILNTKGKVEIAGISFTTKDIDTLVKHIENTVVTNTTPPIIGG